MKTQSQKSAEKGQSLVELGLSVMVLLLLLAGIVDLGSLFFNYMTMRDAAQEGASYGSIAPNQCADIENRVRENLRNPNPAVAVEILINGKACTSATLSDRCAGHDITINVHDPGYELMMPFIGAVVGQQTIDLEASIHNTTLSPACP